VLRARPVAGQGVNARTQGEWLACTAPYECCSFLVGLPCTLDSPDGQPFIDAVLRYSGRDDSPTFYAQLGADLGLTSFNDAVEYHRARTHLRGVVDGGTSLLGKRSFTGKDSGTKRRGVVNGSCLMKPLLLTTPRPKARISSIIPLTTPRPESTTRTPLGNVTPCGTGQLDLELQTDRTDGHAPL
jgi:hypothetical protein